MKTVSANDTSVILIHFGENWNNGGKEAGMPAILTFFTENSNPMSRSSSPKSELNYKQAGVDIAAGDKLVEQIKPFCAETYRPGVISGPGGFAGLFNLSHLDYDKPVLVCATDGIGTKLKISHILNQYDTIGIDLVAMCANDVLVSGAEPVLFLDYFACGKLVPERAAEVVKGIAEGCKIAGCALIGGETAEMPGMYPAGEYDIAGFCVGVAEGDALLGVQRVNDGDIVIGLASSGLHSNGFSLVRNIIETKDISLSMSWNDRSLGEILMTPTHIYVKPLLPLIRQNKIHALAHITGGGISGNLPRVLDNDQAAYIDREQWQQPGIFDWLQEQGKVDEAEMLQVFNCGIGMAVIVSRQNCEFVLEQLHANNCVAHRIGEIKAAVGKPHVVYV